MMTEWKLVPGRRDLEGLVERSDLPPRLADMVVRAVRRARLWPWERTEMAEELIAHFRDGLEAGLDAEALARRFGDPESIGRLAGRAKRRSRPLIWRATVRSLQLTVAVALLAYVASAARLYSARPAVSHPDGRAAGRTSPLAVPTLEEGLDWSGIWPEEAAAVAALSGLAAANVSRATALLETGDTAGALKRFMAGVGLVDSLRARESLVAELARFATMERLVASLEGPASHWSGAGPEALDLLGSLQRSVGRGFQVDVLAADFEKLLDRVYSADQGESGRLTGEGLRRLRTLVGKRDPGLAAMLLEPVYFAVPAQRHEVEASAEELFELARAEADGAVRLREGLAELLDSPWGRVRYIPLALVMPRVARAMESERELRIRLVAGATP